MLVLSNQDIAKLLTMEEAMRTARFAQLRRGRVVMPTRRRHNVAEVQRDVGFMPSYSRSRGRRQRRS